MPARIRPDRDELPDRGLDRTPRYVSLRLGRAPRTDRRGPLTSILRAAAAGRASLAAPGRGARHAGRDAVWTISETSHRGPTGTPRADDRHGLRSRFDLGAVLASARCRRFSPACSCPIPTSLMMPAGRAFAATGDLSFWAVAGRRNGSARRRRPDRARKLAARPVRASAGSRARQPRREALFARARPGRRRAWRLRCVLLDMGLSPRWGPYVKPRRRRGRPRGTWRFTPVGCRRRSVWVIGYAGLGYLFANRIDVSRAFLSNASGFLVAGTLTLLTRAFSSSAAGGRFGPAH